MTVDLAIPCQPIPAPASPCQLLSPLFSPCQTLQVNASKCQTLLHLDSTLDWTWKPSKMNVHTQILSIKLIGLLMSADVENDLTLWLRMKNYHKRLPICLYYTNTYQVIDIFVKKSADLYRRLPNRAVYIKPIRNNHLHT